MTEHYMVLCFYGDIKKLGNLIADDITYRGYVELCKQDPKLKVYTVMRNKKLFTEIAKNFAAELSSSS